MCVYTIQHRYPVLYTTPEQLEDAYCEKRLFESSHGILKGMM